MFRHLSFVVAALLAGSALAADKDVVVTNTAANPVPVTGTVNVANLPATQNVSGTVSVGNLPATQDVRVVNPEDSREVYQAEVNLDFTAGQFFSTGDIVVPPNRRLVIEYASCEGVLPTGQQVTSVQLRSSTAGGSLTQHHLLHTRVAVNISGTAVGGPADAFHVGGPVRLYSDGDANGGTSLFFEVFRADGAGQGIFICSLSGHFAN